MQHTNIHKKQKSSDFGASDGKTIHQKSKANHWHPTTQ